MSESESKFSEFSALIPEIYYDIIARLIPGLSIIWINFSNLFEHSILIVVILGYVIGITSHIIVTIVVDRLTKSTDDIEWKWIRHLANISDRNIYAKAMAEKSMFKNFTLVSIIILLIYLFQHWNSLTIYEKIKESSLAIIVSVSCGYFAYVISGWINHARKTYDLPLTPFEKNDRH
jgi:hypothetical protein